MKLTPAQIHILRQADELGSVDAYMQWRRSVEKLRDLGLLEKFGLVAHRITAAGRAALEETRK